MDIDEKVKAAQEFLDYRQNEVLEHGTTPDPKDWAKHLRQERIKQLARNIGLDSYDLPEFKALIEAILGE